MSKATAKPVPTAPAPTFEQFVDILRRMIPVDGAGPSFNYFVDGLRDLIHPPIVGPRCRYVVVADHLDFEGTALSFEAGDCIGTGTLSAHMPLRFFNAATFEPSNPDHAAILTKDRVAAKLNYGKLVAEPVTT